MASSSSATPSQLPLSPPPAAARAAGLAGRLPLLAPQGLAPAQRELYDYLQESKISWATKAHFQGALADGRLIGPFNAFLYSPQLGQAFNDWIDVETAHTALPARVRQIVILTVGVAWRAAYEVYAHAAVGKAAGLSDELIRSIREGREPANLSGPEAAAYRFTHALVTTQQVSYSLYQQAVAAFEAKGVVDMVHLIGQYLATSALLNAFAVPAPTS